MIKHIVMWNVTDGESDGANGAPKQEVIVTLTQKLEALNGQIPGLLKLEVGADFSNTDASADVVLYSEFESEEALANYQRHPLHQEVVAYVKKVTTNRRLADYHVE